MKIKATKWIAVLMMAMMGLFVIGCDSGSDESEGPSYDDDWQEFTPGSGDKLTLNKTNLIIPLNGTETLKVTPDGTAVIWTSSNDAIATVSDDGTVTAVKVGTATITAKSVDGKEATCEVIVAETSLSDAPGGSGGDIKLNYTELSLTPKSTIQLKVTPADAEVAWKSQYNSLVKVSKTGRVSIPKDYFKFVHVDKYSEVEIIATTEDGKEAKCTIKVCNHVYSKDDRKCTKCGFDQPHMYEDDGYDCIGVNGDLLECHVSSAVDDDGKLDIPYGVTGIESKAFTLGGYGSRPQDLKSVTIPSSMSSFGKGAFYGCENLKDVYYSGTKEEWDEILFLGDGDIGLADDVTIHGYEADGSTETTWKFKE